MKPVAKITEVGEEILLKNFHQKSESQKLSRSFYPFLIMASCFTLGQMMLNTFLSTYTLAATRSAENVKIFNIILALGQPFAMIAAVFMVRRSSAVRAQQIGLALVTLVNVYLFAAVDEAANHIFLISALQSFANGFYFTTYACQFVNYTQNENRDKALGIMGVISNVLSLAFSIGSSLLFAAYPGNAGYRIIFLISFVASLVSLVFSFRLEPLTTVSSDRKMYYRYAHKVLFTNRWGRRSMLVSGIEGIRAGLMAFFLNLLLYSMIDSEALVGLNTFLTTLCGIGASMVYARVVNVQNRYRSAQWSIIATMVFTVGLLLMMNPAGIMIYGAVYTVLSPFYGTPLSNAYWTVLDKLPELNCCRPETHAAREVYYAVGRVAGIVLTMILPTTNVGSVVALLCVVGMQYLGLMLSKSIMRDLDHAEL